MNDNQIQDYITHGRTFENYKWYKPILTAIVSIIIYVVIISVITIIFTGAFGEQFSAKLAMGYEGMNDFDAANIYGFLTLIAIIPSLYIASRIVKDRPFSSYSSSRGGWDWKIYLKSFLISAVVLFIAIISAGFISGFGHEANQLTVLSFITFLIIVPLQCIAEEYFFRGFIMQTIGSWTNMPIVALIVQTLAFAAMHPYNIIGVITILIGGVVFGYLTMKTNGIEASSGLHSANNLIVFYLSLLGVSQLQTQVNITDSVMGIAGTVIAGFLILYIGKKYDWFASHE